MIGNVISQRLEYLSQSVITQSVENQIALLPSLDKMLVPQLPDRHLAIA
jgi:hypothetical protein